MKILNNKNLTQKIIISIVIMISFNFIAPTYSRADFGGVLLGPVIDLVAGIGDAVMALLQFFMDGGNNIEFSTEGFLKKATEFKGNEANYGMQSESGLKSATIDASELDQGWFGWATYSIPIIKYSPEKIFANEVPALDANFINPKTDGYSAEQQGKSIAIQLQETISSWYNALRNLVVVLLLSILLYVGIRMMLTSVSSDKAKYKQMLMDWIVALCLLFFLHYIMSFTMTFVGIITEGVKGATDINVTINDSENGNFTFKTNLTGYCRLQVQYKDFGERLVYLMFYIGLVVYTFKFTWQYMKRAITMAFLTLMAPLVTLTYPIDKIGDGKAQAFNMWLKEYIFNALLQPFHLIIYSIFLGSSMQIAIDNPLYAILFLAFITPAEKILRKFFKFDQTSNAANSFAGGFGGAAAFGLAKKLVTAGAKGGAQAKGGSGSSGSGNIRQQGQISDPNAPDGRLDPFLVGAGNNANESANQESNSGARQAPEQRRDIGTDGGAGEGAQANEQMPGNDSLEQYHSEGFGQNANGEYYNPWTEEYDASYNPATDPSYASSENANTENSYNSPRQAQNTPNNPDTNNETIRERNPYALSDEGERIRNAREDIDNRYKDAYRGKSMTEIDEVNRQQALERQQLNESDQRGVGQWALDGIKTKLNNTGWTRDLGNKALSAKQMAAEKAAKVREGADNVVKKIPKPLRNTARGAMRVAKDVALPLAGRVAAATAMGAIGVGMGIAGDDLEDVFTYGAAGATLGYTAGPAVARNLVSGISSTGNEIRSSYEEGAFGKTEAVLRQQDRNFVNNQDNRDFFEEKMTEENGIKPTRAQLNEKMEAAAQYNRAGITDLKQINKGMKLEKKLQQELQSSTSMPEEDAERSAREQAITIAKIASGVDAKDLRDPKKVENLQTSFVRELKKKDATMSDDAAKGQANRIIDMVKEQKKVF